MIWTIVSTVASLISTIAYVITIYYLRNQLQGLEKDSYLNVTSQLFTVWQSKEFMEDQLWLIHQLKEQTWQEFVQAHRADRGEIAFHRIGSFYDRVGTLVKMGLINEDEILATMGGHAIAVWSKIKPLVEGARALEHSTLFVDFEGLLPACYECYVPSLGASPAIVPFTTDADRDKITVKELARRMEGPNAPAVLDVRWDSQVQQEPRRLPGAVLIPPDSVQQRLDQVPQGREIAVYCA